MSVWLREISKNILLMPEIGHNARWSTDEDELTPFPSSKEYDPTDERSYIWTIDNNEATIIFYKGSSTKPLIPDSLDDCPVVAIAITAFNYSEIEKVAMSDNIKIIE